GPRPGGRSVLISGDRRAIAALVSNPRGTRSFARTRALSRRGAGRIQRCECSGAGALDVGAEVADVLRGGPVGAEPGADEEAQHRVGDVAELGDGEAGAAGVVGGELEHPAAGDGAPRLGDLGDEALVRDVLGDLEGGRAVVADLAIDALVLAVGRDLDAL